MSFARRAQVVMGAGLILGSTVFSGTAARAQGTISPEERRIFEEKCSPCHSPSRILNLDPRKVRETIAKMEAKNPSFFEGVSGDQLAEIAAKMLKDPAIAAQRKALREAVDRGQALFRDPSLGRNGKSCADCHTEDSLRGIVEEYPRYNEELGRLLGLVDKINIMIERNMAGRKLPLGDERTIALEAYLKSLR